MLLVYKCWPFTDVLCSTRVLIMLWIQDDGHNKWPKHVGGQESKLCAVVGNKTCVYFGGSWNGTGCNRTQCGFWVFCSWWWEILRENAEVVKEQVPWNDSNQSFESRKSFRTGKFYSFPAINTVPLSLKNIVCSNCVRKYFIGICPYVIRRFRRIEKLDSTGNISSATSDV